MAFDERLRLSLSGPPLRHRRHQRPFRAGARARRAARARSSICITDDYPGLPEAIEAAAPKLGARPRSAIACGAGPVVGRTLKLTNAPWVMDGPETARRAGLAQGLLLNDFEAQALSLPAIPEDWTRRIGPLPFGARAAGHPRPRHRARRSPALVEADGRFTPVSSEACHIDFGPVSPEEFALWPHLERAHGRVTSESVLNGAGLARVHRARMMALGLPIRISTPPRCHRRGAGRPEGRGGGEPPALLADRGALRRRHGGDLRRDRRRDARRRRPAAGGRFPRRGGVSRAFEAKAPVDGLARRIPTRLITRSDAVLVGMAAIAAAPGRYAIDYASRAWV